MGTWELGVSDEAGCLLRSSQARSLVNHLRMRNSEYEQIQCHGFEIGFEKERLTIEV